MTAPARTLVQTVGTFEIRPRRSSVDKPGIAVAVMLIRRVPACRMKSRARYRLPCSLFVDSLESQPSYTSRLLDATSVLSVETPPASTRGRHGSIRSRQGRIGTVAHGNEFAIRRWPGPL